MRYTRPTAAVVLADLVRRPGRYLVARWNWKPLAERLLEHAGKPKARIDVLSNPRLRGYAHALRATREDLPDSHGFFDLWLFFPDADRARDDAMERLEADLRAKGIALLCCPAEPEVAPEPPTAVSAMPGGGAPA